MITETKCSDHPNAPHGFDRNGSHMAGHYVCECYGWTPPASIQEELRSVPERSRTTLEAADRIDALEAEVESLQLRNQELAGHYVCECSGWTPPTLQERLRSVGKDYDFHDNALVYEAADHIDALTAKVDQYRTEYFQALRERDEYRQAADEAAMKHKVERDGLMADKEVLLNHMATLRNVTKEPQVSLLTRLVLERMAQGGMK